jgi:hypothetical protein
MSDHQAGAAERITAAVESWREVKVGRLARRSPAIAAAESEPDD